MAEWGKCFIIAYLPIFVSSFLYPYIVFDLEIENSTNAVIALEYLYVIDRFVSKPPEIPPGQGKVEVCYIV